MNTLTIGDLAQSFLLQRRGVALRSDLMKLTDELASGQVHDVKSVLKGNHSYLADIERGLRVTDAFSTSAKEAAHFTDAAQYALERVESSGTSLGQNLINVSDSPLWAVLSQGADQAQNALGDMMSALNTDVGGRNLFAGNATDARPLADSQTLLDGLKAAILGEVGVDDIRAAAQDWFDDPLGFEATVYQGSDESITPFRLSEDESASFDITATDDALRRQLMNTALSALTNDADLAYGPDTISDIHRASGLSLINNSEGIVALSSRVGTIQERISQVEARNASQAIALEFSRNNLLSKDPFETATELENVRFQLESLYTITARLSNLALVNFVR